MKWPFYYLTCISFADVLEHVNKNIAIKFNLFRKLEIISIPVISSFCNILWFQGSVELRSLPFGILLVGKGS